MAIRVLPYVTVDVDERLRRRVRDTTDQMLEGVRSYLLSAADDVEATGLRVRAACDAAVARADAAAARVKDRIDPAGAHHPGAEPSPGPADPERRPRLEAV